MSGGFFRGTSAEQDTRFSNKTAKLLKTQKFAPELDQLVDMSKVKMDTIRPWIARRVTELLGFEDEVLINFIFGLLEGKDVDGKNIQIQLTGFMEKNTGKFMKELWGHLTSAQNSLSGIPQQFLDEKAEEARLQKAEEQRIISEVRKKEEDKRAAELERIRKQDEAVINAELGSMKSRTSRSPRRQSRERSPDGIRPQTKNGLVEAKRSRSRSPNGSRSPSVSRSPRFRKGRRDRSLSRSPRRSPRRARRSRSPRRGRSPKIVRSPRRRRSPSYSRSPRRRSPAWSPPRYRRRSPRYARSPPRRSPIPSRRRQALSPSPRRRPQSPRRRISRSPPRRPPPSPPLRRRPAPSQSPRRRPVPSLSPPRRHAISPSPRHPAPSLSPPQRHAVSPSPPRQQVPPPPPRLRSTPPPSPRQLPPPPASLSPETDSRSSPERPAIVFSPQAGARDSVSPQKVSTMAQSGRPNASQRHQRAAHSGREIRGLSPSPPRGPRNSSPSWQSKPTSSTWPRYSSPGRQGIVPASPVREASGRLHSSLRSSRGVAVHNRTPSPSVRRSPSISDGSPPARKRVSTSPKRVRSLSKEKFDSYKQSEEEKNLRLSESRPQKRQRSPSKESSTSGERNAIAAHVARNTGVPDGFASTYSSDDQRRLNVENKRSSRDIGIDMDERNAAGSPSNSDERRKVSKKRRKEEKKMRKEERRRKREERHRRKEEKRAAKAAAKAITSVTPPPDLDNRLVRTDEFDSAGEVQKSDEDDMESEQRRMENELRKKALDSIRARKAVSS